MAFNEISLNRIREILFDKNVLFLEKKMFGGVCIIVDGKMCCGTRIDKKTGENLLLCRIGEEIYEATLETENCIPMEFTGKAIKGYVYITQQGFNTTKKLDHWLQLCLDFNPKAKKSKK